MGHINKQGTFACLIHYQVLIESWVVTKKARPQKQPVRDDGTLESSLCGKRVVPDDEPSQGSFLLVACTAFTARRFRPPPRWTFHQWLQRLQVDR
jgi:hypothetical protein